MALLLCTSTYRKTFGLPEKLVVSDGVNNGLLGPWYGNTLFIGPQRYVHYMSSQTLLSVVVWLRERGTAEKRWAAALSELLVGLGVPAQARAQEIESLTTVSYGRASDRSHLASMRDQKVTAKHLVNRAGLSTPRDIMAALVQMPSGPLAYRTPGQATVTLLTAADRRGA